MNSAMHVHVHVALEKKNHGSKAACGGVASAMMHARNHRCNVMS